MTSQPRRPPSVYDLLPNPINICVVIGLDVTHASVTSISSHTSEARELKLGMHNSHMDGSKATGQIFSILPRS